LDLRISAVGGDGDRGLIDLWVPEDLISDAAHEISGDAAAGNEPSVALWIGITKVCCY